MHSSGWPLVLGLFADGPDFVRHKSCSINAKHHGRQIHVVHCTGVDFLQARIVARNTRHSGPHQSGFRLINHKFRHLGKRRQTKMDGKQEFF